MACMMLPPVATMLCALTCLLAVQPSTACAANLHAQQTASVHLPAYIAHAWLLLTHTAS